MEVHPRETTSRGARRRARYRRPGPVGEYVDHVAKGMDTQVTHRGSEEEGMVKTDEYLQRVDSSTLRRQKLHHGCVADWHYIGADA